MVQTQLSHQITMTAMAREQGNCGKLFAAAGDKTQILAALLRIGRVERLVLPLHAMGTCLVRQSVYVAAGGT
jgi:hypothetical protein